jgi:aminobenzoyl-glutamate utilization protein B
MIKRCLIFILFIILPDVLESRDIKLTAIDYLNKNEQNFYTISDSIWSYAEIGFQEFWSSDLLSKTLKDNGFEVQKDVSGMPTAFIAIYGSGKPVIAFLAEFDALQGLSQKAGVTKKEPVIEGAPGHGLGHNTMGAAAIAAAIATKFVMQENNIDGTIMVFGTPAEETLSGKIYMVRDGLFKNVDAVLDNHASNSMNVEYGRSGTAMISFKVTFTGKTAHAVGAPWMGRSALDAVEIMNVSVNYLREHIEPEARIHYVITEGGVAPNIVPDKATVHYFVREQDENIQDLFNRVINCAKGASIATECDYNVNLLTAMHQKFQNKVLAEVIQRNIDYVGMPDWNNDENNFAKNIQKEIGVDEAGLENQVEEFNEASPTGGSTDVGDVSLVAPTATLRFPVYAPGSPGHHWSIVATTPTSIGHKGLIAGAKVLACSALDLLTDSKKIDEIKAEFTQLENTNPYVSLIPEDKMPDIQMYKDEMNQWRNIILKNWDNYWQKAFDGIVN